MEILTMALLLLFLGALAVADGKDSRPSEQDHIRNW